MRLAIFLTVAAMAPASAQLAPMKQAPAAVAAKPANAGTAPTIAPVTLQTIGALEKEMDRRLAATGGTDPCAVLGETRGLYVSGLGAVFTAEVELAATPGVGVFQTIPGPEQKAKIHKNKLDHVPLLEQTMREMAVVLAGSPPLKLSDTDQVVVAVRLVYRPWEDMTGLPGQIVMRFDRRGSIPKMEVQ